MKHRPDPLWVSLHNDFRYLLTRSTKQAVQLFTRGDDDAHESGGGDGSSRKISPRICESVVPGPEVAGWSLGGAGTTTAHSRVAGSLHPLLLTEQPDLVNLKYEIYRLGYHMV